MSKLDVTLKEMRARLRFADRPVVLWSSGLDSMTMLHMAREIVPDIPVIFLHEKFQQHKLEFARRIIQEWRLTVYDLPVIEKDFLVNSEEREIYKIYPLGDAALTVPLGINKSFDESNFKCALEIMARPISVTDAAFDFDLVLHGQRGDDVDPIHGSLHLNAATRQIGQTQIYYPFHDWQRSDVVDYARTHRVPVETRRYDVENHYTEFADKTFNLDYHDICTRCVVAGGPQQRVQCPKINEAVDTIEFPDRKAYWRARFQL